MIKSLVDWIEEKREDGWMEWAAHHGVDHEDILDGYFRDILRDAPLEERARIRQAHNAICPNKAAAYEKTMQADYSSVAGPLREIYEKEIEAANLGNPLLHPSPQ